MVRTYALTVLGLTQRQDGQPQGDCLEKLVLLHPTPHTPRPTPYWIVWLKIVGKGYSHELAMPQRAGGANANTPFNPSLQLLVLLHPTPHAPHPT
ncbi:MAG: hypothetical protein F6J93_25540 [Oscillatoria sp. SIO1A7]|nr:hypothetical protein [Oscillatoria sp. SIO1A7]